MQGLSAWDQLSQGGDARIMSGFGNLSNSSNNLWFDILKSIIL
ncbi:hypothetical protein [Metamycoplasma buccale]